LAKDSGRRCLFARSPTHVSLNTDLDIGWGTRNGPECRTLLGSCTDALDRNRWWSYDASSKRGHRRASRLSLAAWNLLEIINGTPGLARCRNSGPDIGMDAGRPQAPAENPVVALI